MIKSINLYELKTNLIKKLNFFYIFLGDDFSLLEKNQELIINFAYKKGFSEKVIINIEKDKDWEQIILFHQNKNLFFKKTILVINFFIKKLNLILTKHIHKLCSSLDSDFLIILKFKHLSYFVQRNKLLNTLLTINNVISCFTPYNLYFINWIKYEIKEKNIHIEEKAFFLLCKYYEGNTLFIYKILDILFITWPNTLITINRLKKIIIDFFDFSPLYWVNAILKGQIEKSFYILNAFSKKKYNPLILVRSIQKDLLKLIYMKREKKISINILLEKYNIQNTRKKFFVSALKKNSNNSLLKAIQFLVKIEIKIKKKYDNNVWNQLQALTLILCK